MPSNILIIEDEPAIADTLLYALTTEGFAPHWCATGQAGLAALADRPFDFVVLDIGLPDGSGFEFCKQIRARSNVPILFLTARNSEIDRVVGLEIGGDDYLAKPFSPRELTARVKAILRRVQPMPATAPTLSPSTSATSAQTAPLLSAASFSQSATALTPASPASNANASAPASPTSTPNVLPAASTRPLAPHGFEIDDARCIVRFRNQPLELTRIEFRLCKTLVAQPGRVFTREQLLTSAWDEPEASLDRTVDAHVKTLRAKLHAIAPTDDPIKTHRGLGYSLRETC